LNALLVARHGRLVFEKSIVSTLVGIALGPAR